LHVYVDMRMSPYLSEACHRTRQQISLRLDSELSEFEEALVAAHLGRCVACSTFADDLQSFTDALRSTPPAAPAAAFTLPRRPARVSLAFAGSAAAAALSVAGALIVGVSVHSSASRISSADIQSARDRMILKEQQMQELDVLAARSTREVPRGVMAAKGATVTSTG
jgi:predicted anti-sigma-YlaC factor YlaD